jgi:hypothetical protein
MVGEPRLTQQAVEQFEAVLDAWKEMTCDRTITAEEASAYMQIKQDLYQLLLHLDESFGLAVTMLRRGHDAPSFKRRLASSGVRLVHSDGHDAA